MVPFGIKKRLKALIKRLIVRYVPNTVRNCPCAASEAVNNIISTVNVFKKQCTDNKAS